jgi:hypothetical protein
LKKLIVAALILAVGCAAPKKGYDYKAHSKKGKSVKYKGDLTKYKCKRGK